MASGTTGAKKPPRPRADAELDQALRELGDEILEQEVPERLRGVLDAAIEAANEAKRKDETEPRRQRPDPKTSQS